MGHKGSAKLSSIARRIVSTGSGVSVPDQSSDGVAPLATEALHIDVREVEPDPSRLAFWRTAQGSLVVPDTLIEIKDSPRRPLLSQQQLPRGRLTGGVAAHMHLPRPRAILQEQYGPEL